MLPDQSHHCPGSHIRTGHAGTQAHKTPGAVPSYIIINRQKQVHSISEHSAVVRNTVFSGRVYIVHNDLSSHQLTRRFRTEKTHLLYLNLPLHTTGLRLMRWEKREKKNEDKASKKSFTINCFLTFYFANLCRGRQTVNRSREKQRRINNNNDSWCFCKKKYSHYFQP